MKKLLPILLCLALPVVFAGCGKDGGPSAPKAGEEKHGSLPSLTADEVLAKLKPYMHPALDANALEAREFPLDERYSGWQYRWLQTPVIPGSEEIACTICRYTAEGAINFQFSESFRSTQGRRAQPLTKEEALQMAQNFARDFIPGGEALAFALSESNGDLAVCSAYKDQTKTTVWTVMIDLPYGYVLSMH